MFGRLILVAVLFLAACGGARAESATRDGSVEPAQTGQTGQTVQPTQTAATAESTAQPAPTAPLEPTAQPEPTATAEPTAPPEPTATAVPTAPPEPSATAVPPPVVDEPSCRIVDDFESGDEGWQVVLDGVMGGRSNGQATISQGFLRLAGTIDTNGGGFVMLRRPIEPAVLDGATSLRFVADVDGRGYEVIADDALAGRNRSVSHFASIDFQSVDDSDTSIGIVELADLVPRSFGNPISTEPFRPDLAFSIGVIVADGIDGDFVITLDRIEACA